MKNLFALRLPSQWTLFPMIYGNDQIIAEVSSWTMATRIRVNDEIIHKGNVSRVQIINDEKVSETHTFSLPDGKEIVLTTGISVTDGKLFCSAEADGTLFYEKSFSEPESQHEETSLASTVASYIIAGIIGGFGGYYITQFILGAL